MTVISTEKLLRATEQMLAQNDYGIDAMTLMEFLNKTCDEYGFQTNKPKTGHWIFDHTNRQTWMKCSECGCSQGYLTGCWSFCPICGSSMEDPVEHREVNE